MFYFIMEYDVTNGVKFLGHAGGVRRIQCAGLTGMTIKQKQATLLKAISWVKVQICFAV